MRALARSQNPGFFVPPPVKGVAGFTTARPSMLKSPSAGECQYAIEAYFRLSRWMVSVQVESTTEQFTLSSPRYISLGNADDSWTKWCRGSAPTFVLPVHVFVEPSQWVGGPFGSKKFVRLLRDHGLTGHSGSEEACWESTGRRSFFALLQRSVVDTGQWAPQQEPRHVIINWLDMTCSPRATPTNVRLFGTLRIRSNHDLDHRRRGTGKTQLNLQQSQQERQWATSFS